MKISSSNLEKKLKIKFTDSKMLTKSLTHKSYDSKNNNEKIEFLGDRVLGSVNLSFNFFSRYVVLIFIN